jgi:predicted DNA-binding ribbon-helix-helix protein
MASILQRRPSGQPAPALASLPIRNVVVAGHRTSVRLEPVMWQALRDIAREQGVGLNDLVTEIALRRGGLSLTAAIRVYIVDFYRAAAGVGDTAEPGMIASLAPLPI